MLGKRILTAAVLMPLLAGAVMSGWTWPFPLFVGGVVLLCAMEFSGMFFPAPAEKAVLTVAVLCAYASGAFLPVLLSLPAVLAFAGLAAIFFAGRGRGSADSARAAVLAALGALYIGGFLSTYVRTIRLPGGRHWVLLGVTAVAAGDVAAYFTGRAFGRRPLAPRVSPNKTVEGAVGGLAASLLAGAGYGAAFLPHLPWGTAAFVSVLVGAVGQAGDLFESFLKRAAGVKDSGTILPGHGGMFDRADAAIAAGPVLYLAAVLSTMAGGAG